MRGSAIKNFGLVLILTITGLFACTQTSARAQSSYIDLTLVCSKDYNLPLATFSHDAFENAFKITSDKGDIWEENMDEALWIFLRLLEPGLSYIVQHEPTYYFVFQYNATKDNYLVMNNSIGEKNQAIYVNTMEEALQEMMKLLQVFYANTSVFNVTEYSAF